ncbi:MAG: LytR/AlgR family response regulator transcription factor [Bacteroidia bacterium]|jgi:two-component system LytT family response regulator
MKDTLQAVIVDDEAKGIEFLRYTLEKHCPEVAVIKTFTAPLEALEEIPELRPDILFVDVEMPRMNGFELVERLQNKGIKTIFVTAYNEYALKAFRVAAVDYLLKPIDSDELKEAVQKVLDSQEHPESGIQELLQFMKAQQGLKKVSISTDKGIYFLEPEEIIYCTSDGSYCELHLMDGSKLVSSKALGEFEKILSEKGFFRIHHSSLINVHHLRKFSKNDGGFVEMVNGAELAVSRRKKDEFLDFLNM